jgi:hypothetical protein
VECHRINPFAFRGHYGIDDVDQCSDEHRDDTYLSVLEMGRILSL